MILANHHAHTNFSDGRGGPEDYISEALRQGLVAYGFSDHAPIPHNRIGIMTNAELEKYGTFIDDLKIVYANRIQIHKSLEVDYIPGVIDMDSPHIKAANLDYLIGAVHYVDYLADGTPWGYEATDERFQRGIKEAFAGDVQAAVTRYYALIREMLSNFQLDVVAHIDRIKKRNFGNRYWDESAKWYQHQVLETLEAVKAAGCVMEINTKGYYKGEIEETYPGKWALARALELGIPVHLSSDAHDPQYITGGFDFGYTQLKDIGYESIRLFLNGEWQDVELVG